MIVLPRPDVHQHPWPAELLAALERHCEPSSARRAPGTWRLHVAQPLLDRPRARDVPRFVPGPAGHDGEPWWPALTSCTVSPQAAWWGFG
jgi:hypothetical protein